MYIAVCVCLFKHLCEHQKLALVGTKCPRPQEFEGIFEAENVILELELGYG